MAEAKFTCTTHGAQFTSRDSESSKTAPKHAECKICGNGFAPIPGSKALYCSRECFHKAQRQGVYNKLPPLPDSATCQECKKEFRPKRGKSNLFCGLDCYRIAQRAGKYKRGSKRIHECAHCGSEVVGVTPSKRRSGDSRDTKVFCDRDCYDAHRAAEVDRVYGHCEHCSAPLSKRITQTNRAKFCSMDCRVEHKRAKPKNCMSCGCWFTPLKWHAGARRLTTANEMKTCSEECYRQTIRNNEERKIKIGKAMLGANHPNWLGGAPITNRGYRGSGWQAARKKALHRDKYRCVQCGISDQDHRDKHGYGLDVNHIRPFWQFRGDNQKANRLSNLESLCRSCHQLKEWDGRKNEPVQSVLPFGNSRSG